MVFKSNLPPSLVWLLDIGVIDEVIRIIKSGKESLIYLTRRSNKGKEILLAAKVHLPRTGRAFRREYSYREGWYIGERTVRKAVSKMTSFGRRAVEAIWVEREYDTLTRLYDAEACVPRPIIKNGNTILMSYLGDIDSPAPKLVEVEMDHELAHEIYTQIIRNIKIILDLHLVHGDLSSYNTLYWKEKVWLIDFPQAADIYRNPNSVDLFYRDLVNICNFFKRKGVIREPLDIFHNIVGVPYRQGVTFDELYGDTFT